MAYQPVSKPKTGVGYVPVTKKAPELSSFFPIKNQIARSTYNINNPPAPPKPTASEVVKRDKERGVSLSQGQPEKISPIRKLVRAIPGDSRFEKSLERDVLDPLARVGKFLAPSAGDMMKQIVDENPKISSTELQKELQKRISQGGIALNAPGTPITSDTKIFSPDIVGMIKKVPSKLAQRFINAKTADEALTLAKGLGIKAPDNAILKKIVGISDDVSAQNFIDDLKKTGVIKPTTEQLPSLPKLPATTPVKSVATKVDNVPTPTAPVKSVATKIDNVPTPTAPVRSVVDDVAQQVAIPVSPVAKLELTPEVQSTLDTIQQWISGGNRRQMQLPVLNKIDNLDIKPQEPITLYRVGDVTDREFQSWSKIKPPEGVKFTEQVFKPEEILLDTTDPRLVDLYTGTQKEAIQQFNKVEGEVIVKPQALRSTKPVAPALPPLPKLPAFTPPQQVIDQALERYKGAARKPLSTDTKLTAEAKKVTSSGGFMKLASEVLTPISSRLMRINPSLKTAIRDFEFKVATRTQKDAERVLPLLKSTSKMSPQDQAIFDLARKNGDSQTVNALGVKYGITKEITETRAVLDDLFNRAKEVGLDVGYRGDYFPRTIKNPTKFISYLRNQPDWSALRELIEQKAKDKGKFMTDLTDEEISGIINNYVRGYGGKIDLAKPGFTKTRSIEVIDEALNEFYESSDSALTTYIIRMNDEIEGRRFFGKELKASPDELNTEQSIGAYVLNLIQKGQINDTQAKEVSDILKARFHRGKMNGALDTYRNVEYVSTMGSVISAVTQLGDVAFSMYKNGLYHTAKGIGKAFSKSRVTKEDLGIEQIIQEFSNQSKTGKALEKVFKATGLNKMDRLGKETLVNGAMSKKMAQAKSGDDVLRTELNELFDPEEAAMAMKEFANGELTERTKFVLFNTLLDFQPVAKSEMPQKYLEMPNGRIFYMLKSFTLKQFDVFRREAIDDIVSGNRAKGMKNLLLLAGAFVTANATADEVKDFVLGRETDPSDKVVDNIMRLVGATKFDVYNARERGIGMAVMQKLLFPASLIDRTGQDIYNIITNKTYEKGPLKGEKYGSEAVQSIPIVGKLYYWWFGRGAQKEEYKQGSGESAGALPPLPKLPALPALPKLPKI